MRRKIAVACSIGIAFAILVASSVTAETKSQVILGQTLYGNTSTGATDTGGTYSNGLSWRTGCCGTFTYMSVGSRGHNSETGWHQVWSHFLSCSNCNVSPQTKAYRCGTNPSNCAAANYVTSRHYFESGLIGGSTTFFTSHNGARSTYSCYYYSGC